MNPWKVEKGTKRRKQLETKHDIQAGGRLLSMNQRDKAERLFRNILKLDPMNDQALNALAVCIFPVSPLSALECLTKALEIMPSNTEAQKNLHLVREHLQQTCNAPKKA